jgi:hypothetical protein
MFNWRYQVFAGRKRRPENVFSQKVTGKKHPENVFFPWNRLTLIISS